VARKSQEGVAADAGRGVLERLGRRAERFGVAAVEGAQALERPEGVNRAGVQADRVDAPVGGQLPKRGNDVQLAALDQKPLRVLPPKQVVALEGLDESGRVGR